MLSQWRGRQALLLTASQLTPLLALLLTHDLLLSKNGVAAPANHFLKLAISRHKARLSAEFTKVRIKGGYVTLEAFKEAIVAGVFNPGQEDLPKKVRHPRWVRINTVNTTCAEQLSTTFAGYARASKLAAVLSASGSARIYFQDPNIPNLLAFPPDIDLSTSPAYIKGNIIFQDKASCFPAYLLNVTPEDGDVIDGCAAPGNKTTHLAAIISDQDGPARGQTVIAFERDKVRTGTLQKMVKLASADRIVLVKGGADFLVASPDSEEFSKVGAILLDPSCSGSGIVGRDDTMRMRLPDPSSGTKTISHTSKGKKRKRDKDTNGVSERNTTLDLDLDDSAAEETPVKGKLAERLTALSAFQLRILTHAMRFPKARKITYSTCSVHFKENEGVVFRALASQVAKERGWAILKREHQVDGLKRWERRGIWDSTAFGEDSLLAQEQKAEVCEACIRCEKGTADGTMGFFVAAFVRDDGSDQTAPVSNGNSDGEDEDEWKGFSDEDDRAANTKSREAMRRGSRRSKKKRRKNAQGK